MNTINNRIKELVSYFSNGNNSDFATKIGINEANIRNYINTTEPKFNVLEKIARNFDINFEWLLTGNSEMLKTSQSQNVGIIEYKDKYLQSLEENRELNKENRLLNKKNRELRREIDKLKEELLAKSVKEKDKKRRAG